MDRAPYRNVAKLRALLPGGALLVDVGGGTGRVARHLRDRYRTVLVTDVERAMLVRARAKGLPCVLADAARLPFKDGAADALVAVDAFHHFPDQERALSEAARVARRVVLEEFDPTTLGGALVRLFEKLAGFGSRFHAPDALARLARGAAGRGVDVVRFGGKDYAIVVEERDRAAVPRS